MRVERQEQNRTEQSIEPVREPARPRKNRNELVNESQYNRGVN
jgi:hypothetical protein